MEKYTMVKSEVQANGDIFLFYVDENGTTEQAEGVITTTIDQNQLEQLRENYVLQEVPVEQFSETETNEPDILPEDQTLTKERWLEEETKRLLIFYIDNKEAFQSSATRKKHLWTVACKTMLTGKNPTSCEMKLRNMKRKYSQLRVNYVKQKVDPKTWPYYDLCHQAFHDDSFVKMVLSENGLTEASQFINYPTAKPDDTITALKKMNRSPDEKVKQMLELYLQFKKNCGRDYSWQRYIWEKIAVQLGEDGDYWHKRFLNFKQHYIRMIEKRNETGSTNIVWPYMSLFDQIFGDDIDFQRKYGQSKESIMIPVINTQENTSIEWDDTEKTVLVKYCFDCFDEFQDHTIPKGFLWNEIGRLLDKTPESCKKKYEDLKNAHLDLYIQGSYNLQTRKPLAILFDNIISKEIAKKLKSLKHYETVQWPTEKVDELVQFLFDNIELFKDPVCHFVIWATIAKKLEETVENCREQWRDLTTLYKSILNDKKEDSDLQIDWRYIDLFDRIFDYGMDSKLLEGYEPYTSVTKDSKIAAKKVKIKTEDDATDNLSDDEDYDEKSAGKRSRGTGDPKQIKILEYYLKNKDKFATTQRRKQALWEVLARQIGISAEQCAHRFRNLKQVYTAHIQKEINKPEMPILWPYYALCKKVFGYRAIKNKLKNGKIESDDSEEWSMKEIKALINYFANHFQEIDSNTEDKSKWTDLAQEINKSESACKDKFLELRKSYRKIKTMKSRNVDCKVNWKYFKLFEEIYTKEIVEDMNVDSADEKGYLELSASDIKTEMQEDDDYQCIIVIPEGEEIGDLSNAKIILKETPQTSEDSTTRLVWQRRDKVTLLKHYYQYLIENEGKVIKTKDLWQAIAQKFPERTGISCKRMFIIIKTRYLKLKETDQLDEIEKSQIYKLMRKILSLKPKLVRSPYTADEIVLKERTTYDDIAVPLWKVEKALKYYLNHVDEFINPKYDKKYAWIQLAQNVTVPVTKIFKKINYLKQFFNSETGEVNGVKFEFGDTLKEILEKEFICKIALGGTPEIMAVDEDLEVAWSDEEIEQLLLYYLENLDKFKNPKYAASYLWMEAAHVLQKSPLGCSKKMTEIRSQYSSMVKESPEALNDWRFYELCQKIYGTGKKSSSNGVEISAAIV